MPRKPKFRPEITRVKLNPEQAVLYCLCYNNGIEVREVSHSQSQGNIHTGSGGNSCFRSGGPIKNLVQYNAGEVTQVNEGWLIVSGGASS